MQLDKPNTQITRGVVGCCQNSVKLRDNLIILTQMMNSTSQPLLSDQILPFFRESCHLLELYAQLQIS